MRTATLILSAISCIASVTTLAVVLGGAKKVQAEVDDVKNKTNATVKKLKDAINDLEL